MDGHVWLQQLAYPYTQSIVETTYTPLAMAFLQPTQVALGRGLELVFVFDGARTPAKEETDLERH